MWDQIRDVVKTLSIPVIANGGISSAADAAALLEHTGAAAVMSGEALLENPALFACNRRPLPLPLMSAPTPRTADAVRRVAAQLDDVANDACGPAVSSARDTARCADAHASECSAVKESRCEHGNGERGNGQQGNGERGNGQQGNGERGNGEHGSVDGCSVEQRYVDQDELAARYLELCVSHPPRKGIALVKDHCRRMLHHGWRQWPDLYDELYVASDLAAVTDVTSRLRMRGWDQPRFHTEEERPHLSWYRRHRLEDAGPSASVRLLAQHGTEEHASWVARYLSKSAAKRHSAARKRLARLSR